MRKLLNIQILSFVFLILVAAGGIFGAWFFYNKYQQVKKNPEIITKEETAWLLERIGKLMSLPADEMPTIATVIDKEKLKDQTFFKNAQNGDKVLVYTKAQKAILYRPNDNKIIEVMPISFDTDKKT